MDAGRTTRLFPGYTTKELKSNVVNVTDDATRAKMEGEIARREAGASVTYVVPQIEGGRAVPRVGRM
jgi:hypothetical protein